MPYHLLYDNHCSLCVRFKEAIRQYDRKGLIEPVGFDDPRITQIVPNMTRQELENSFHLVSPDGKLLSGHHALPALLKLLPGFGLLAWILKYCLPARWLSDRVYLWLARHRKSAGVDMERTSR